MFTDKLEIHLRITRIGNDDIIITSSRYEATS